MAEETTIRLIYIHGFRGDHTSFQAFPTDLHEHLRTRLPTGLVLESCLYPTYKSRRPIAEASSNFIDWLGTLPPGPVVLLAHSMGGLLAAEVVTSDSEQSKRVIGLVAFDVPFLGMHPHVIISGISSLFPKEKENKTKTEKDLNDENIVKHVHGDDVESARVNPLYAHGPVSPLSNTGGILDDKQEAHISTSPASSPIANYSQSQRPPLSHSPSSSGSQLSDEWEAMKATFRPPSTRSQNNLSPYSSSSTSSRISAQSLVSSFTSTSSSYLLSRMPPLSSSLTAKLEHSADRIVQHADSPLVRWLHKHADDPLSAMTKWVVEHFEFGICMFDPAGLSERYLALERWNGNWVNFWTETPARGVDQKLMAEQEEQEGEQRGGQAKDINGTLPSNTADLARFADADEQSSAADARARAKARKSTEKALRKERAKERKRGETSVRPARHFIVLPHARNSHSDTLHFGSRERWELVPIRGVEDEVGAHCGLFIRAQNPDYEELVGRVAGVVEGWYGGLLKF